MVFFQNDISHIALLTVNLAYSRIALLTVKPIKAVTFTLQTADDIRDNLADG